MMRHFCTYFDSGYLDRALVLLDSMRRHVPTFTLHVLAFDDAAAAFFTPADFPEVRVVPLPVFEAANPDVAAVKAERTRAEYYFTCTAAWICHLFDGDPAFDVLAYLDADCCFHASPDPLYNALASKAVLVAEHGFEASDASAHAYGRFNVGVIAVRRSAVGLACMRRWRTQCVEWCHDRVEDGKFADQKYLDEWPERCGDQLAIAPPGVNTGPWALAAGTLGRGADGALTVYGHPLVLYHFQGVRLFHGRHYYPGFYFPFDPSMVLAWLYEPYVRALQAAARTWDLRRVPHGRYGLNGWAYRMATGYWLGRPRLTRLLWLWQRYVLRLPRGSHAK